MSLISKIQSLISSANAVTGESRTDLTSAVQDLKDGYGGSTVTKGLVFSEYDSDGYPHKAEFVGSWTEIPNRFLYYYQSSVLGFMSKVTYLKIPDGVINVSSGAFQMGLNYVTELDMPNNNITVNESSFHSINKLEQLYIKKDIYIIGVQNFDGAVKMTSVIFGGEVNKITKQCFRNANMCMLYDFSHCTSVPPLFDATNSLGHANGCVIKVPQSLLSTWQNETNWSALTDVVWQGV